MKTFYVIIFLVSITSEFIIRHPIESSIKHKKFKIRKTGKMKIFKRDNYRKIYVPLKKKKKRHLHQRHMSAHTFYGVEPLGIKFGNHHLKIRGMKKELKI